MAGRFTKLSASLDKVAGRLEVQSTPPEAEVFLDGRAVGKTPKVLADVEAGDHVIEVRKPGYAPARNEIRLGAGSGRQSMSLTLQRFDELEASIPRRIKAANAMWGVAAGLAVTSVVLFFIEGRKTSSGKKERTDEVAVGRVRLMPMVGQTSGAVLSTSF